SAQRCIHRPPVRLPRAGCPSLPTLSTSLSAGPTCAPRILRSSSVVLPDGSTTRGRERGCSQLADRFVSHVKTTGAAMLHVVTPGVRRTSIVRVRRYAGVEHGISTAVVSSMRDVKHARSRWMPSLEDEEYLDVVRRDVKPDEVENVVEHSRASPLRFNRTLRSFNSGTSKFIRQAVEL
ncbi:hypothetical protein FB45DRAFT_881127, partial [Roridomyces roridus]